MRAAASPESCPGAGAPVDDDDGDGDDEVGAVVEVPEVDVGTEVDVDDVDDDVDDVVGVVVVVDVALGEGWSFAERANAVPVVTASAPATTAPTSNFLVMPVPSVVRSGTGNGALRRPMGALPDG